MNYLTFCNIISVSLEIEHGCFWTVKPIRMVDFRVYPFYLAVNLNREIYQISHEFILTLGFFHLYLRDFYPNTCNNYKNTHLQCYDLKILLSYIPYLALIRRSPFCVGDMTIDL